MYFGEKGNDAHEDLMGEAAAQRRREARERDGRTMAQRAQRAYGDEIAAALARLVREGIYADELQTAQETFVGPGMHVHADSADAIAAAERNTLQPAVLAKGQREDEEKAVRDFLDVTVPTGTGAGAETDHHGYATSAHGFAIDADADVVGNGAPGGLGSSRIRSPSSVRFHDADPADRAEHAGRDGNAAVAHDGDQQRQHDLSRSSLNNVDLEGAEFDDYDDSEEAAEGGRGGEKSLASESGHHVELHGEADEPEEYATEAALELAGASALGGEAVVVFEPDAAGASGYGDDGDGDGAGEFGSSWGAGQGHAMEHEHESPAHPPDSASYPDSAPGNNLRFDLDED